jgi:hypothetical protein
VIYKQKSFQSIKSNYGCKVNSFLPLLKHCKISYLTLAKKSYQPLFSVFARAFLVLVLALGSALGRAAATSSAMSVTFVLVACPKVFLHSGQAVISSSGDDAVVTWRHRAIIDRLPVPCKVAQATTAAREPYSFRAATVADQPHSLLQRAVLHICLSDPTHTGHDKRLSVQVTETEEPSSIRD